MIWRVLFTLLLFKAVFCDVYDQPMEDDDDLEASAYSFWGPKAFKLGHVKLGHIGGLGYGSIGKIKAGRIGGLKYGSIGGIYGSSLLGAANPNANAPDSDVPAGAGAAHYSDNGQDDQLVGSTYQGAHSGMMADDDRMPGPMGGQMLAAPAMSGHFPLMADQQHMLAMAPMHGYDQQMVTAAQQSGMPMPSHMQNTMNGQQQQQQFMNMAGHHHHMVGAEGPTNMPMPTQMQNTMNGQQQQQQFMNMAGHHHHMAEGPTNMPIPAPMPAPMFMSQMGAENQVGMAYPAANYYDNNNNGQMGYGYEMMADTNQWQGRAMDGETALEDDNELARTRTLGKLILLNRLHNRYHY